MRTRTMIRKLLCSSGFAILLLCAALPARADDDFAISVLLGKPGQLSHALGLDAAQVAGFRQFAATANAAVKPLLDANEALLGQIQGELRAAAPDTCKIGQQVASRHQNWLAAKAAYLQFDHDFTAILSAAQVMRYEALKAAATVDLESVQVSEDSEGGTE